MNKFLLDLWHDLRERRLWPVAALLAAALVAVPTLLLEPARDPGPPAVATPAGDALPQLQELADVKPASDEVGSSLSLFDPKNPFRGPKSALGQDGVALTDTGAAPDSGAASADSGDAGGAGGGESPGGPTGAPGPAPVSPTPAPPSGKRRTTAYTYVVDATFSTGDRSRRAKGMRRLEMLPSQESPLLIFLGVDSSADNAVFLVDSGLKASGEGHCAPAGPDCATLSIGAGSVHRFTDEDGTSYTLRIDEIRRVRLARAASPPNRRADEADEREAASSSTPRRRFVAPLLLDLVTVATPSSSGSSGESSSR